jgi:hypothetical protein
MGFSLAVEVPSSKGHWSHEVCMGDLKLRRKEEGWTLEE